MFHLRRRFFDPMPRPVLVLGLGGLISSMGSAFVWPLNTTYIHFVLGKSLTMAGLILMLQAGAGVLGQVVGGFLYDRYGGKPLILGALFLVSGLLVVIGLVRGWPVYVAAMTLLGFGYGVLEPSVNATVGRAWPEGGRRGFNFLYVARNAGLAMGAASGGFLAQISFTMAFLANATTALIYSLVVLFFLPWDPPGDHLSVVKKNSLPEFRKTGPLFPGQAPGKKRPWLKVEMGVILLGVVCVWVAYAQWWSVISVYMQSLGYNLASYSILWTINGLFIVLGQPLVSFLVRRWLTRLRAQMVVGTLFFTLAFGLMRMVPRYPSFVAAMIIGTLGEMLVLPALPTAVSELAPLAQKGFYQGLLGGAASLGRMLGPLAGGFIYDRFSAPAVLSVAMSMFLVASGLFSLVQADSPLPEGPASPAAPGSTNRAGRVP